MNIPSDWFSIYIAIVGTAISGILAYLSYSLNRQSHRASTQRSIEDLYDKMVAYREKHPEVMKLCNLWKKECFDAIYRQRHSRDVQWVIYYNYMELVSGFVNAVLYGHKSRLLDRQAYEGHYKSLVKLLVTEHYLYFLDILESPYLSSFIKEFIHHTQNEGWDFIVRHAKLTGTVPETGSKPKLENDV
jgi:hypothetical protein